MSPFEARLPYLSVPRNFASLYTGALFPRVRQCVEGPDEAPLEFAGAGKELDTAAAEVMEKADDDDDDGGGTA